MSKTPLLFCLGLSILLPVLSDAQAVTPAADLKPGPQTGQKVAFLGDSITANGWNGPGGYVRLVVFALDQQGQKIEPIPAGVSGNTSKDMLARLDRDVLSKKPEWMTLSCGVNDVWHGANGVPLDQYKQNITSIVDQATAAGIRVVILTPTMIAEDQGNENNQKLVAYIDFLHALAKEKHLAVAELNADEQAELARIKATSPGLKGPLLTVDGVHANGMGNQIMAAGILEAFGFTEAQIAQAKAEWMDIPNAASLTPKGGVTVKQYLQLQALAQSQGKSLDELLNDSWNKDVQTLLSTPVPPAAPTTSTKTEPAKP